MDVMEVSAIGYLVFILLQLLAVLYITSKYIEHGIAFDERYMLTFVVGIILIYELFRTFRLVMGDTIPITPMRLRMRDIEHFLIGAYWCSAYYHVKPYL